jgi:hypothetical protein
MTVNISSVLKMKEWKEANDIPPQPTRKLCEPSCVVCGGLGWVRGDFPLDDPRFGRVQPCPNMDLDVYLPEHVRLVGLTKQEQASLDWQNILPLDGSNAVKAANQVRSLLDRGYGWIYLWGDFGTAKTLILQIAVAVSLRRGLDASYVRMAELLDHVRDGYESGEYSERLQRWESVSVLCLDEFERVNETGWVDEKRFLLMDNRYVAALRRESVTIMAGNRDPSTFDGYLWDRIRDGRFEIVKLSGESIRPGMEWTE